MIFNSFLGIVTDLMNVQDPLFVCEHTALDKHWWNFVCVGKRSV